MAFFRNGPYRNIPTRESIRRPLITLPGILPSPPPLPLTPPQDIVLSPPPPSVLASPPDIPLFPGSASPAANSQIPSSGQNQHTGKMGHCIEDSVSYKEEALKMIPEEDDEYVKEKSGKGPIKFGWIEGVFMRCLLNIWGVMLFLRLTWVIGQAGMIQGILLMTVANVVTVVTTTSMSAICTNGQIKGGGVYYMISRSLGPEFGGAIGLMFTLANSIAVSMYVIGFVESLRDMFKNYISNFNGIFENETNDIRLIGIITLIFILILALVGMEWVTRVQKALLFLLIGSQIDFVIGTFISSDVGERAKGFTGWSLETATANLHPNYVGQSFWSVFSVFFPAVTGIVAGANLSGDLKDPATAIPKGTLGAIGLTYFTYVLYGIMVGCTYLPFASGNITEYMATINPSELTNDTYSIPDYSDCSEELKEFRGNNSCEFGSVNHQQTMAVISVTGYLIYFGCFAATLSSAIASLCGAPRVLQALAKDKLYPKIEFFAPGYGANNDPVRGYILVFCIALVCILIGDLNVVSGLLSNFFVASYALINFSAFHASITKSPGWRPTFKLYNPWFSLFGTLMCTAVMFLMEWATAIITLVIIAILYMYIHYRKPDANWGSSTQAQIFIDALKSVQHLTDTPDHVKNFRPKVLVLSGNPTHRMPLIDFANLITKKLSLLIAGHVVTEMETKNITKFKDSMQEWMNSRKIKGFYNVVQHESFETGAEACLSLSGLGKLAPNMLLMGFKTNWNSDWANTIQYLNVLDRAFDHHLAVLILRVRGGFDYSEDIKDEELIEPENLSNQDCDRRKCNREDFDRKISMETKKNGGRKKVSIDRAQVNKFGMAMMAMATGGMNARDIVADIRQFQDKIRRGNLDIWWLYDDGGISVLLPHILQTRQQFAQCTLRIFTLATEKVVKQDNFLGVFSKKEYQDVQQEFQDVQKLLTKFRINADDIIVIPNTFSEAENATWNQFKQCLRNLSDGTIDTEDLEKEKDLINKHLRLGELLTKHSSDAQMILMTLPQQRRGTTNSAIYMACLDFMTRNLPPILLTGGNNISVLTFQQ